jgi:hypothetical protein
MAEHVKFIIFNAIITKVKSTLVLVVLNRLGLSVRTSFFVMGDHYKYFFVVKGPAAVFPFFQVAEHQWN